MKKLYYSISEVSELTSVDPHVLRYWETIFKDLHPKKNKAGNRVYRDKDIEVVIQLRELIQEKKYSTEGARQVLEEGQPSGEGSSEDIPLPLKKDLKEIRLFLSKLVEKL